MLAGLSSRLLLLYGVAHDHLLAAQADGVHTTENVINPDVVDFDVTNADVTNPDVIVAARVAYQAKKLIADATWHPILTRPRIWLRTFKLYGVLAAGMPDNTKRVLRASKNLRQWERDILWHGRSHQPFPAANGQVREQQKPGVVSEPPPDAADANSFQDRGD